MKTVKYFSAMAVLLAGVVAASSLVDAQGTGGNRGNRGGAGGAGAGAGGFGGFAGVARPDGPAPEASFDFLTAPPPMEVQRMAGQLELTDDQKAQLNSITQAFMESVKPIREQIKPLAKQLSDAMLKSKPDAAAAKTAINSIQQLRSQIANKGVDYWVNVRAILTTEQNEKLTEILKQRLERGWRPGPGGIPGQPGRGGRGGFGGTGGPGAPDMPPPPADGMEPDPAF